MIQDGTLMYYKENAVQFAYETQNLDFSKVQNKFLDKLEPDAVILDFGCGAGRDTKYFLEKGFQVEAIDGCLELCRLASEFTRIFVKQMLFEELEEKEKYNAVWACASILHLPKERLKSVLKKLYDALKKNGILYTSFKYGIFEGNRKGRYFTDMTGEKFFNFLHNIDNIGKWKIEEQWITSDIRSERGGEQWMNFILRKL